MEEEKGEVGQQEPGQRVEMNEGKEVKDIVDATQVRQAKAQNDSKEGKSEQQIQVLINNRKEEEDIKKMAIELIKQTNDQKLMRLIQLSEYLDKFDENGAPKGLQRSQIQKSSIEHINEYIDNIIAQNEKALEQCDQLDLYLDSIQGQLLKSKQK